MKLNPYEKWMVKQNLTYASEKGTLNVVNHLRAQGYNNVADAVIKGRLDYLRGEIEKEKISYLEIFDLQSLVDYIEPDDVDLLQWAGVSEGGDDE